MGNIFFLPNIAPFQQILLSTYYVPENYTRFHHSNMVETKAPDLTELMLQLERPLTRWMFKQRDEKSKRNLSCDSPEEKHAKLRVEQISWAMSDLVQESHTLYKDKMFSIWNNKEKAVNFLC